MWWVPSLLSIAHKSEEHIVLQKKKKYLKLSINNNICKHLCMMCMYTNIFNEADKFILERIQGRWEFIMYCTLHITKLTIAIHTHTNTYGHFHPPQCELFDIASSFRAIAMYNVLVFSTSIDAVRPLEI